MSKGVIHLVLETMRALADYWATEYDWRPVEARLQALPQFVTAIDGVDIHLISTTGTHQRASELAVGVVTGIVGGPYLFWLLSMAKPDRCRRLTPWS